MLVVELAEATVQLSQIVLF